MTVFPGYSNSNMVNLINLTKVLYIRKNNVMTWKVILPVNKHFLVEDSSSSGLQVEGYYFPAIIVFIGLVSLILNRRKKLKVVRGSECRFHA